MKSCRWGVFAVLVAAWTTAVQAQEQTLEELSAGFCAKVLASAVYVSERDLDEALKNSLYPFLSLFGQKPEDIKDIHIDQQSRTLSVTFGQSVTRTAKYYGDQGCVLLPMGADDAYFELLALDYAKPDDSLPWPMGDVRAGMPIPAPIDEERLKVAEKRLRTALDLAFQPNNHTVAMVVVHQGLIIAERYGEGADKYRKSESWSMGKSLTAILYGRLMNGQGPFNPFVRAGIEAWQEEDDPRQDIRVADLFRMSSGLKFTSRGVPQDQWDHAHPDHSLVYTGAIDVFAFSASRPVEHPPNTVGRYRNCDPLLVGLLVKQGVEERGENYLSWPKKMLFDKLGIRNIVLEPDPYGNFVMTGFEYGSARDWARLGMLMEQDGVWRGERLLPEGFVDFVTTPAPAWRRGEYGGLFWLNTSGGWNLPRSAYRMAGQGGQYVFVVPTHDLVIVRMGHQSGARAMGRVMNDVLGELLEAVSTGDSEATDRLF